MIVSGVGFDCETRPFRPGVQAPPAVTLQWSAIENNSVHRPMIMGGRDDYPSMIDTWVRWLLSGILMSGANTAYDMLCMVSLVARIYGYDAAQEVLVLVFQKYARNEVTDVLTRQKMLDLAAGRYRGYTDARGIYHHYGYGLDDVTRRHTGRTLEKGKWEGLFGSLEEVPLRDFPSGAVAYALEDGLATSQVTVEQETPSLAVTENFPGRDPLVDQWNQVRAAFWLKLMSTWGVRTNPQAVHRFAKEVREEYYKLADELADTWILPASGCPVHDAQTYWRGGGRGKACTCLPLVNREYKLERKKIVEYVQKLGRAELITKQGKLGESVFSLTRETLAQVNNPATDLCMAWPKIKGILQGTEAATPHEIQRARDAFAFLQNAGIADVEFHKSTKAATEQMIRVCRAMNREPKRGEPTEKMIEKGQLEGNISLDKEACESTGDPILNDYVELSSLSKTMSTDIPALLGGTYWPIHTRFEEFLATNRTSSSSPNLQNPPRLPGMRECIVPREGCVFIDGDYKQLELFSLGQVCLWVLGWSRLAELLNAGLDAHNQVGATMAGCTYEHLTEHLKDPVMKNFRDCGKVANFGIPGGLGPDTLVVYAKKSYGVTITREKAVEIKEAFFAAFPEMRDYFRYVNSLETYPGSGSYNVIDPWSGRLRADATFCSAANDGFQGTGANVAKRAGWYIAYACYVDRNDPLFGCRPILFIHDEWLIEARREIASEAAKSLEFHMNRASREILTQCPTRADVKLSTVFSKKSERIEVQDPNTGEMILVPWEPEQKEAA